MSSRVRCFWRSDGAASADGVPVVAEFVRILPSDHFVQNSYEFCYFCAVHSPDRELRQCFEERLRALGWVTQMDGDADCLLFDADPWNVDAADTLRRLRSTHPDAAVVALMNFAPPEDVRAVTRCGADVVIPKLVDDAALIAAVTSAMDTLRPSASESSHRWSYRAPAE